MTNKSFIELTCVLVLAVSIAWGSYVITTPYKWTQSGTAEVCLTVTDPEAPEGSLNITITTLLFSRERKVINILKDNIIQIPAGMTDSCYDVAVPVTDLYDGILHISGSAGGARVNHTVKINLMNNNDITIIQTDKYLYKPGQNVKFRILTIIGAELEVSTKNYPKVYVTTPSRTRIAQWNKVDNSAGLVHLDFDLADEPEKGMYTIHLRTYSGRITMRTFMVDDFVLPRFDVKISPPRYILASDEMFTFTVCANYTYGQPVKGTLSLHVSNGKRSKCLAKVTKHLAISGCKDVEITAVEMKITNCNVTRVTTTAVVTEQGTDVQRKTNAHVSISRTLVSFNVIYDQKYVKPNLPYILKLRAELPDGSPAGGVPVEVCAAGRCTNITTAQDGLLTAVLSNYDAKNFFMKALNCRAMMDESKFSRDLEHYFSPSKSSLLIHAPESQLKCVPGQTQEYLLPVLFSASDQTSAFFSVQVTSRGKIQYHDTKEYELRNEELPISEEHLLEPLTPPPDNTIRGIVYIKINLPLTASPKATVLVWYTREDGEVVADSRELEVDKCLANKVDLTWSVTEAQPGDEASLTISSEPNSICSLGVVDKSSELLAKNRDPLTISRLFEFVSSFDVDPRHHTQINTNLYCRDKKHRKQTEEFERYSKAYPGIPVILTEYPGYGYTNYYSDYVDAMKMFEEAGLHVLSTSTLETRPCEERIERAEIRPFHPQLGYYGPPIMGDFLSSHNEFNGLETSLPSDESTTAARTEFPETWLWNIHILPPSGVSDQAVTVPDTITEWVGKAVCVHPVKGVGLSQRKSIITFTPFFVDLTLPPTVKRGEILPVKMSIFNYLSQSIPVTVKVMGSSEYDIQDDPGRGQHSSCLAAQDNVVHTVKIKPSVIGDVNITVTAFVDQHFPGACASGDTISRRDTLIKAVKVEAEGVLKETSFTKYICSEELITGKDTLEAWELAPPSAIVEGSARAWVTVVGDLLALSLENLGNLIRMPYGCGEQNMVNFAPNVFIMQYLRASHQTTPESTQKLLTFMKTGYQRELLYQRYDGSFSAFGDDDYSGSTWLSAFVLKSFAQARDFIQIDNNRLNKTRKWLKKQQGDDGCFRSVGKVFSKAMKGGIAGSDSLVPLTAYVMISLLEAGEESCSPSRCQAAQCLHADTTQHPYTLALKAYAFSLAKLPEAESVLQLLLSLATVTKNSVYWELPDGPEKSQGIAVETCGYAIMAMMTQDPERYREQAMKVIKWITSHRNGQGGFYSTQDTVVALQALALYETYTYQGPLYAVASVSATGFSHSFVVTEDNKLLQQVATLPTLPTTVSLNVDGQGCVILQAVLRFNIPEEEGSDAFDMTVMTKTIPDSKCVTKHIAVCAYYRLFDGASNMAVIEVDLISGYIPEKKDLWNLKIHDANIKRFEVDGGKISFYLDELTNSGTCVHFSVIRATDVENVKPGTVRVYDYYQPEMQNFRSYTLPPSDECN